MKDLFRRVGGDTSLAPRVNELRKTALDGVPYRNNCLIICLLQPSDILTLEQVITNCEKDPSKKTTLDELIGLAKTELAVKNHDACRNEFLCGHIKIICQALYPDAPKYSCIFNVGTAEFTLKYL